MHPLDPLFQKNQEWAKKICLENPDFFPTLSRQQTPEYLWIGCADSRVPANEICGLLPGEIFVHRNVANLVVQTDLNCLSVMQFAVDVLKVKHIIVCGHYGCGGIRASLNNLKLGLIDNWLRNAKDIALKYNEHLKSYASEPEQVDRLCELNVITQVINTAKTTVMQDAWERGQSVAVHGWVYGLSDGLVRYLDISLSSQQDLERALVTKWELKQARLMTPKA